eukprot:6197572-Pleurochrysis_carterae.AAC.3
MSLCLLNLSPRQLAGRCELIEVAALAAHAAAAAAPAYAARVRRMERNMLAACVRVCVCCRVCWECAALRDAAARCAVRRRRRDLATSESPRAAETRSSCIK